MNIQQLHQTHDADNEVYLKAKAELFSQDATDSVRWMALANRRLDKLATELSQITPEAIDAAPSYLEPTDCFASFYDDIILECTILTGRRKEIETQILDLIKEALGKPVEEKNRDFRTEHVTCSLVDALVMHESPLADRGREICKALLHNTNPMRLGLPLYVAFCEKYPEVADIDALRYFQAEEKARDFIMHGELQPAVDEITKLFDSKINSPEKFLMLSLTSYGSGLIEDAIRTLEIGLTNYPGNERLQSALDGLNSEV